MTPNRSFVARTKEHTTISHYLITAYPILTDYFHAVATSETRG